MCHRRRRNSSSNSVEFMRRRDQRTQRGHRRVVANTKLSYTTNCIWRRCGRSPTAWVTQNGWTSVDDSTADFLNSAQLSPFVKVTENNDGFLTKSLLTKRLQARFVVVRLPLLGRTKLYNNVSKTLIVNKNLAVANRSRVNCAHNTLWASVGLNITPWPLNLC